MQIEKLVLAAINVVRQAFGHGTFVDPNTMTTRTEADNNIHRYLADAPSINDDTIAIDVYETAEQPIIVFTYNHDDQIIAGETWTWIMLDEAVVFDGTAFRLMSPDTVERLHLQLNKQLAHFAK